MTRARFVIACLVAAGCSARSPESVEIRRVDGTAQRPVARSTRGAHTRFEGNELVQRAQLLDAIQEDDPERDEARLVLVYYDLGYLQARVEDPVVQNGTTTYRIHEGRRFRIGKIEARDVDADGVVVTTPDRLPTLSHLHARSGEWFSRHVWVDDLKVVRALYQDVGYPCVEIPPATNIDVKRGIVDVTIEKIDLGPLVTIDHIDVVAPSPEVAARVRKSIAVADGDTYNASKLEAERQRILATRKWSRVDVSYEMDGAALQQKNAKATIRVELTP
jgi:outer membrane protein assembly factor BamA